VALRTQQTERVTGDFTGSRVAIVVARFNENVTEKLLEGALETLRDHGLGDGQIRVFRVPGAFEIPLAASRLAAANEFDAILCLGAVVQGETLHHEYINAEVARGIMELGLEWDLPILFGVLTCRTMEQALERAGGKAGNKGTETALAALEMITLLQSLAEEYGIE
jgi:6,7-dimethyl-8-ribityllumazine synthase